MTIAASDVTKEASWPDEIPRNYEELYKQYAGFVATAIRKHNKIGRNFEEQFAFIWKRLIEKDVIGLFLQSAAEKQPKHLTALQACSYAGVSFEQWRVKMWRWHVGTPIRSKHDPKLIIGRRQGGWMPTPVNADEFRLASRQRNAVRNANRIAKGLPPLDLGDTIGSRSTKALYTIEDVVALLSEEKLSLNGNVRGPFRINRPTEAAEVPATMKVTRAHFQAYLSRSIYSDWCNWCRTYKRKWEKDRPMFLRQDEEHDDSSWESELRDPRGAAQETQVVLKEAVERLSLTLRESMIGLDCEKRKPLAQTEMQMFELLEQGVPLPEAMKKLDVPERVRRAVLKSISDIRVRAA